MPSGKRRANCIKRHEMLRMNDERIVQCKYNFPIVVKSGVLVDADHCFVS